MNWKEIFAILESKTDGKVYRAGGSVEFDELPEPGEDHLGYVYNVTDAFETTADFVEGAGISYPAGTNVIIVDVGTESEPVYKYDVLSGLYEVDDQMSDVSENPVQNKVVKAAIEEAAEGEEIATTATSSELTLSTSAGNINSLTVYGKSEVVNNKIISAGEGYAVVDLRTLNWTRSTQYTYPFFYATLSMAKANGNGLTARFQKITNVSSSVFGRNTQDNQFCFTSNADTGQLLIRCDEYTNATGFKNAMSGVLLCYELADPAQGNAIAVKTDNGTGIDGTMAVFETGTPLRGIPDTDVRDVMQWDGSAGTVTKNCGEVDLGTLNWSRSTNPEAGWAVFTAQVPNIVVPSQSLDRIKGLLCPLYPIATQTSFSSMENKSMLRYNGNIVIKDNDYTDASTFKTAMTGVMLVYELATPTKTPLTASENASIAALKTFEPTTYAQNNAGATMTIEAYAGTQNGKAVADLKKYLLGIIQQN